VSHINKTYSTLKVHVRHDCLVEDNLPFKKTARKCLKLTEKDLKSDIDCSNLCGYITRATRRLGNIIQWVKQFIVIVVILR
jgi:hypothetical protein